VFSRLGVLNVHLSTPPLPSGRQPHWARHVAALATKPGEICGLAAISGRGSRKDFIDLYIILRGGLSLEEFFRWLPQKYGEGRSNAYHVLKSLTYFEDAESEPMPKMLEPFNWDECKAFFVREAHAIVLP